MIWGLAVLESLLHPWLGDIEMLVLFAFFFLKTSIDVCLRMNLPDWKRQYSWVCVPSTGTVGMSHPYPQPQDWTEDTNTVASNLNV